MEKYLKVEPGADEFSVKRQDFLVFRLESPAENGQANSELVKRIQHITGKKPGIVSGHRSRRKKIRIDMDEKEFEEQIKGVIDG
jgi:uncharacterized protein (TIGR00251 family)